jgi:hypothetical protein
MKRTLASLVLATIVLLPTPGCGTLMFSERQHEPHSGKLDPNLLILNGLGLLLYVVPGLVAFGVDFYTGAIYLPEGSEKGEGPFIRDSTTPEPEEE